VLKIEFCPLGNVLQRIHRRLCRRF
jgi:hypothetical protein